MRGRATLVLGGARSGKSRYAEGLARGWAGPRIYIATAEARDEEMRQRIALHRKRRAPGGWVTVEAPLDLEAALLRHDGQEAFLLVDCLTLWISNLMLAERDIGAAVGSLARTMRGLEARSVFVSNEVGLGIVPDNALARRFRDAAGSANQAIAAAAPEVVFMAAGLPLKLKG